MNPVRIIVIGCGNMGASHARAYHNVDGFELAALVDGDPQRRAQLSAELGNVPGFERFEDALAATRPDAAAVCTWPDTHAQFSLASLRNGLHVFTEKPIAETVPQAREIVDLAKKQQRKVVVGYILRHHPSWTRFVAEARTLGKPLIMRMNLNQQSSGRMWHVHKQLMKSMSPIVDCGVHYVDIMCQMTRSKPIRVQAIGARVSTEIAEDMYNYGQLQVVFADGSVGWYEAGWGPMMSETAFFVKDVIGPNGCISIAEAHGDSDDIDSHTKTSRLLKHSGEIDSEGRFAHRDQIIDTGDEPDHQELCNREQRFFLKAICDNVDLGEHLEDAINSLRIVVAADQSVKTGKVVHLNG